MFLYLWRVLSYMLLAIIVWIFLLFKDHTFLLRHSAVWLYYFKVLLINTGLPTSEVEWNFWRTVCSNYHFKIQYPQIAELLSDIDLSCAEGTTPYVLDEIPRQEPRHFPSFVLCAFLYRGYFCSSFLAWCFKELM